MSRTIVVTGGATGIGRAVAERFRADGETVVITGRRSEVLEKAAAEIGARAVVCDAADPAQLKALLRELPDSVDVLVNNAGGNADFASPDAEGDLGRLKDNWRAQLRRQRAHRSVDDDRPCAKARCEWGGRAPGSIAGARGAGSYGAAKAALATWNQDIAAELGARGITSNVVAPGFTAETEFFQGRLSGERRQRLLEATMTKREGEPADIAAAIHFLASPAARHITAQVLHVNGGALTTR